MYISLYAILFISIRCCIAILLSNKSDYLPQVSGEFTDVAQYRECRLQYPGILLILGQYLILIVWLRYNYNTCI